MSALNVWLVCLGLQRSETFTVDTSALHSWESSWVANSASFRLRLVVGLYLDRAFHMACVSSATRRVRFHSASSELSVSSSIGVLIFLFRPYEGWYGMSVSGWRIAFRANHRLC